MMTPDIEQLLSQLERQSESLNKEIQCRKQAEFLAHQHIETLEAKNKEITLFANIAVRKLQGPLKIIESNFASIKNQVRLIDHAILNNFIIHLENSLTDIRSLLDYYRAYTSPKSTNTVFTPLFIGTLLEQAIKEQSALINTHQATILYNAAQFKDCPPVLGNEEQLSAVIQQLISNAIQFRSEEKPQIEFKFETQKNLCLLSIQDNGQGINPKYFEQIFWFIKPDEISGEYKRNSIGLAICKKVIENHQGKMWVTSNSSGGSTFYILLPVAVTNLKST